jgi:hypothetical protein
MMPEALTLPRRMRDLPLDKHGRPVPWFVAWLDDDGHEATPDTGTPDFRIIRPGAITEAVREDRCWVCGQRRGSRFAAFVIGPMCAVNRTTAEPPCHRDCAAYSAQVCPFLTTPGMRRRTTGLEDAEPPAGIMIPRNPGVTLVWVTRRFRIEADGMGGALFKLGDPAETIWLREGRPATGAEVLASIDSGLPALRELAEAEGPRAEQALRDAYQAALPLLPA